MSTSDTSHHPLIPLSAEALQQTLDDYLEIFTDLGRPESRHDLDDVMSDFAQLVTDPSLEAPFAQLMQQSPERALRVACGLREQSARCAAMVEKRRAHRLLRDGDLGVAYFDDVQTCIDREMHTARPTSDSTVVLVGSGSFPMTPLKLARATGARIVGVDIDPEAVELGRQVVARLGPDLPIHLEPVDLERLPALSWATHVIFSSTVAAKYDLLERIHPLTREDVVVAMRFGDGLKSLFNYPRRPVDELRWRVSSATHDPDHVFDIALYTKAADEEVAA